MRGIAAQSHCRCSHALWLLVLLHQACFDAAPELPMTWLPAPIQRNCTRPWPMNFGCGATIQPLVASRRATLQGKPSRYSNSTMYCVNAWCDSPIRTCSTLSMRLAMRYGCVNFKQSLLCYYFLWQWFVLLKRPGSLKLWQQSRTKVNFLPFQHWCNSICNRSVYCPCMITDPPSNKQIPFFIHGFNPYLNWFIPKKNFDFDMQGLFLVSSVTYATHHEEWVPWVRQKHWKKTFVDSTPQLCIDFHEPLPASLLN